MSKAFRCDHCGRYVDGEPAGGVVTRTGLKEPCSAECFVALASGPDVCTLGELEDVVVAETRPSGSN